LREWTRSGRLARSRARHWKCR